MIEKFVSFLVAAAEGVDEEGGRGRRGVSTSPPAILVEEMIPAPSGFTGLAIDSTVDEVEKVWLPLSVCFRISLRWPLPLSPCSRSGVADFPAAFVA